MKTTDQMVEGHEFVIARYEISHLLQCSQKHMLIYHAKSTFSHHEHNKEGGSPKDPKVGYKCNVTPQGLKDGKDLKYYTM